MNDDDGFPEFWGHYPRKVARKAAHKAWQKLRPDPSLQAAIHAAIDAQTASDQWQNTAYIPYPATWINGERWMDELPLRRLSPQVSRLVQAVAEFNALPSPVTSSRKSLPGSRSR